MFARLNCVIFTSFQGIHHLCLVQFRPGLQHNQVVLMITEPPAHVAAYQQQLSNFLNAEENLNVSGPLCNVFEQCFQWMQNANNQNGRSPEKLVIMFTDTNVGDFTRFETLPEKLNNRSITLAIVDVNTTPGRLVDERYRSLARATGGTYMSITDAQPILGRAIVSTLRGARIYQGFNPDLLAMESNDASDGVGELEFDHGLSQ